MVSMDDEIFDQGMEDGSDDNDDNDDDNADEVGDDPEDNDQDNDQDQDQDADQDADQDHDQDQEQDADPDPEQDQDQDAESQAGSDRDQRSQSQHLSTNGWPSIRQEALVANTYDIVPTVAAPQSTSINAICATSDMRYVFSGGSDGYIRKFNWADTVNSKLMLTVAQRHPFVDSVVKAGVLMSYWENWANESKPGVTQAVLSPVYSLAAQQQGLWLLAGLENGGIRLQSIRHEEGKEIAFLKKHTSAVSVLNLYRDEQTLLSGSWDKIVCDWDMQTGQVRRSFSANAGQISAIEVRPESGLGVPSDPTDAANTNGTYSSNILQNGNSGALNGSADASQGAAGSPTDSLFGGGDADADSLFGDNDAGNDISAPSGGEFHIGEDDEFSKVLANGVPDAEGDVEMSNMDAPAVPEEIAQGQDIPNPEAETNTTSGTADRPTVNGLPHSDHEALPSSQDQNDTPGTTSSYASSSDTTFLASSIDGTIRIWDRRQPSAVAKILPRNTPPWCMSACWSPDGNFIYAGRRNGSVEEFSLHKGFRAPERVFRFPHGSGSVTVVKAMPNGKHLICASHDILRLYDIQGTPSSRHSAVPFLIVPGHRTGVVSHLYMDPACRFLISTGGNRGWEGNTTEVFLGYEIGTS